MPVGVSGWTLAIDFGTSNSAAAHSGATSGGVETLSLTHTSNLMSSAVFVADPGRIAVGEAAIDAAQQHPAGFVAAPKRLIGAYPTVTINTHTLPTAALVAAVLRTIIARGQAAHAGTPPSRLVLTHPEAWAPQQIQVLIDAAAAAGIPADRITTLSEPRAAAAHYSRSHTMAPGSTIAVFDFGGGTLDIAVLSVTDGGGFHVVAARGDNGLGGKNVDALIQRWVTDHLAEADPDLVAWLRRAPVEAIQTWQESIRRAKELLSEAPSATITVPGPQTRTTVQITRHEFDDLITPAVDTALQLTRATLYDAGITGPDQLRALYLTGGSSRIPQIQQRLGELGPVATLDDPKTVVAQGALLTALGHAGTPQQQLRPRSTIPAAADLMPSWHTDTPRPGQTRPPQPASAPPTLTTPPHSPRRRWGRIAAVTVAVLAVGGIAAGVIAATGNDTASDTPDPAQAGATSSAAAEATGTDGGRIADDVDTITAALPATLQSAVTDCRKLSFTDNNALVVNCDFTDDGALAGLQKPDSPRYYLSAHVDDNDAATTIINIRNGTFTQGKGTLVEDTDRHAAAEIEAPVTSSNEYTISYANTESGLLMTVYGLNSIDDARTFLTRSGLIT